tara:strand:- start:8840 stop:9175 length:336 start_codon:yes stop_codon:yes gene_type:complete
MKLNIRQVLKSYQGENMKMVGENDKERDLTVRDALNSAINGVELNPQGQQKTLTAEDKGRIYQLSTKLWSVSKDIDLSVEEAAFIKKRLGVVANVNPLLFGRISDLLEKKD